MPGRYAYTDGPVGRALGRPDCADLRALLSGMYRTDSEARPSALEVALPASHRDGSIMMRRRIAPIVCSTNDHNNVVIS